MKLLKKIIVGSLLVILVSVPVFNAVAQIDPIAGLLGGADRVPVISPDETPLFNSGKVLANFVEQFIKNFKESCGILDDLKALEPAAAGALNALALIGDNGALITKLKLQEEKVRNDILCRETWLDILDKSFPSTSSLGTTIVSNTTDQLYKTEKLKLVNQIETQISALKQIQNQLEEQIRIAERSWWKAVLVSAMLTVARESLSTIGDNLSRKFLNTDLGREVGNAAALVYDTNTILRSTKDNKDRMIIHSILTNPIAGSAADNVGLDNDIPSAIAPAFLQMSDKCIAENVATISYTQPDFLQRLANVPNCQSAGSLAMSYNQGAGAIKTQSVGTAQTQIGKNDYKSTYDCSGVRQADQKQRDAEYKALLAKYKDRRDLYYTMKPDDPRRSQVKAEMDATSKEIDEFYYKKYKDPVVAACTGLYSSSTLFETTLKDIVGKNIDNITDYDPNNLPFAQRALSKLISTLTEELIFGKKVNTGSLLTSVVGFGGSVVAGAIGNSGGNSGIGGSTNSGQYLSAKETGRVVNEYVVTWDASSATGAAKVFLTAVDVDSGNKRQWNGGAKGESTAMVITATTRFELDIFDINNRLLVDPSPFLTINPKTASSGIGGSGSVAGVYTQSEIHPRGEPMVIKPRGEW